MPPLRDRPLDLEALILEFARRHARIHGPIEYLEPDLIAHLRSCRFEGNVRPVQICFFAQYFDAAGSQSPGAFRAYPRAGA